MNKEYIEVKYGFKEHIVYIVEVNWDLGFSIYDAFKCGREIETTEEAYNDGKIGSYQRCIETF